MKRNNVYIFFIDSIADLLQKYSTIRREDKTMEKKTLKTVISTQFVEGYPYNIELEIGERTIDGQVHDYKTQDVRVLHAPYVGAAIKTREVFPGDEHPNIVQHMDNAEIAAKQAAADFCKQNDFNVSYARGIKGGPNELVHEVYAFKPKGL